MGWNHQLALVWRFYTFLYVFCLWSPFLATMFTMPLVQQASVVCEYTLFVKNIVFKQLVVCL